MISSDRMHAIMSVYILYGSSFKILDSQCMSHIKVLIKGA